VGMGGGGWGWGMGVGWGGGVGGMGVGYGCGGWGVGWWWGDGGRGGGWGPDMASNFVAQVLLALALASSDSPLKALISVRPGVTRHPGLWACTTGDDGPAMPHAQCLHAYSTSVCFIAYAKFTVVLV